MEKYLSRKLPVVLSSIFLLALTACQPQLINPSSNMSGEERAALLFDQLQHSDFSEKNGKSYRQGLGAFNDSNRRLDALREKLKVTDSQDEQNNIINEMMKELKTRDCCVSLVFFRTEEKGARVKYQLITETREHAVPEFTNSEIPFNLGAGTYYIWVEREGIRTSEKEMFDVISRKVVIELEEN